MATQWPMRSFWVTAVLTDDTLLNSEPATTQMSLLLNLVTTTKAHEYAASLGLIYMSIFVTSDLPKKPEVRYRSLAFALKIDLRKTTWSVTPKRMKLKKRTEGVRHMVRDPIL